MRALDALLAAIDPAPPDKINTQGILVQSVFAIDRGSRASTSARTWGQVITGRFQDGIEAAIQDFAGQSSPLSSEA